MSAYHDALLIDDASSDQRLDLAAQVLLHGEAVILLDGVIALRPDAGAIVCEVVDPAPGSHRCAAEFQVLVENAGRQLARSRLSKRLPNRPLRWVVVEDCGTSTLELWRAT